MAAKSAGGMELVLDGAPLPAALDPDVAGTQPVAQGEQRGRFPDPAPGVTGVPHRVAPSGAQEGGGRAARPPLAAARVGRPQRLDRTQRRGRGRHRPQPEGVEEQGADAV
jgi:hypothetical protein